MEAASWQLGMLTTVGQARPPADPFEWKRERLPYSQLRSFRTG